MQHDQKIHRITIFIVLLFGIVMSGITVVILSHNVFAQPQELLYNQTLYERTKETSGVHQSAQIDVGDSPQAITASFPFLGEVSTVYVVNSDSDTVSVISTVNNTKIKDIAVGDYPTAIGIAKNTSTYVDTVYVVNEGNNSIVNEGNNSVSVISGEDNTRIDTNITDPDIDDIAVGQRPVAIAINDLKNRVYVSNYDSHTVSVISRENNTRIDTDITDPDIDDIAVGDYSYPTAIEFYEFRDLVYVVNGGGSVSIINATTNTKIDTDITDPDIDDIRLLKGLVAIAFFRDEIAYVVNENFDNVSVISAKNNTQIDTNTTDPDIDDIAVGQSPVAIAVSEPTDTVYVVNEGNNSVSVISAENNTKIKDIAVGQTPHAIAINELTNTTYVVNEGNNSVSVISAENNTKIKDIAVGDGPSDIDVNKITGTVYVSNRDSDTVSVIDGITNKVIAGVTFQIHPFNSGYILCDDLSIPSPIEQYTYIYSGDVCTAKPNEGFEFHSWEENLDDNSTQPIQASRSASPWDSFVLAVTDFFGDKPDKPESKLNITKFGTFTANFRKAADPLPPEFWAQMYVVIVTVITGLFIPSIVSWFKSKREAKKLNYFHNQIDALYQDGKLDEKDIKELDDLRNRIENAYPEGKLNEKHYESLSGKISVLYDKIFKKRINDLSNNATENETRKGRLDMIRKDLDDAYSEGKINEKHYTLLNEDISKLDGKEGNKKTP